MMEKIVVKGYEAFKAAVVKISGKERINVYFTGSKDENGLSWCPDCVGAQPHIDAAVEKFAREEDVFITVDVGDRPYWKDIKNPFRLDKDIHISVIPSLIRWKGSQRLDGHYLLKDDILEMFFTDEED